MGKTAPSPCLGYPGMSMPPFSPFHGYPSLFFLFPVGTLDENHATAQKTFPHYGMDTSQQPRDKNQITHKNSLFLSWCILLALCFAFVSAAPAAAAPTRQKYDKAIRDMGSSNPKNSSSVSVGKACRNLPDRLPGRKKMERALSGLVPLRRKRWIIWPAAPPMPRTPGARWTDISSSSASIPKARWPTTACTGRHGCGARSSATRPERKNCSNRSSKNTLLPIRPKTPPVTLRRSRPKKNGNRLPPPARQASKKQPKRQTVPPQA